MAMSSLARKAASAPESRRSTRSSTAVSRAAASAKSPDASSGKTTIAASFASAASRRGEVVAWSTFGHFDPASLEAAGADLRRMLWASLQTRISPRPSFHSPEVEASVSKEARPAN